MTTSLLSYRLTACRGRLWLGSLKISIVLTVIMAVAVIVNAIYNRMVPENASPQSIEQSLDLIYNPAIAPGSSA